MNQTQSDDDTVELNGVEITDLESAAEALSHLNDDYNDGSLSVAEGGNCLVVTSRSSTWGNFSTFQQAEHVDVTNVRAVNVGGTTGMPDSHGSQPDVRLVAELREADR